MAVSISQKNDLKKDVDQTRRFLANSHRRRSTYELLIPNEDGNGPQTSCCPQNHATQSSLGRISEKVLKNIAQSVVPTMALRQKERRGRQLVYCHQKASLTSTLWFSI